MTSINRLSGEQERKGGALTRREFVRTAALGGTGLVIAVQLTACSDRPREEMASDAAGDFEANAWLRIAPDDTITFFCDRSEMGQGVYTSLTTLIAEELEVPVASVRIHPAPADDVTYINALLGVQVTGGSTSIRDAWVKLRQAGAEARVRLVQAAALRWGLAADVLEVSNGRVSAPDGQSLSYGELAGEAAALPVPADIALKSVDGFAQIGRAIPRVDTPEKVSGRAQYGIDSAPADMAYAAIALSPVLEGSAVSWDDTAIVDMPGVQKVVQTSAGPVVVADTWWQAKQARDALQVEWNAGANAELDNAAIYSLLREAAETRQSEAQVSRNDGDVEAALNGAEKRLDEVYELPMLAHATLEPQNCTVELRGDEIHVHVPTQVQGIAKAAAAAAAGVADDKVFVHTTLLGGGFGRRLDVDFIPPAVEAAVATGRSVKLLWTREDDTTHDFYRPPVHHRCSAAMSADGALQAWRFEVTAPSITARWAPAVLEQMIDPFALEAATNYPYAVPNVKVSFLQQEVGIGVGYWRSVSHATNCFSAESFMDELADAAGQDPYEFRRGLLAGQDRWRRVLDEAAAAADWGQAEEGRYQGIALMEGYGTYMAEVAEISLEEDGQIRVHRITCAVDCGRVINPDIVNAQVQSGIVFGLSAALWGQIDIENGQVQQQNFSGGLRILRIDEVPQIDVVPVASDADPGGMGEPSTALVAPAVCNAVFAATGRRLRSLPLSVHGLA